MRSFKQHTIFSLLILSICYDESTAADSPCGDWESYKDEKCFKIFDKVGLQNYEDAEKTCQQQESSSSLVSIRSLEEQEFFSKLLFKTHKVIDTVWIGAKYISNKFKWVDDSDLTFTNWVGGSPKNKTDYCAQMQSDEASVGKWIDEPCGKNNLVVCQKMQTWSLSHLQKIVLDSRKELEDVKKNPVPIGFIYVQLPNEKSPSEIWPWMTWSDVSSPYAGVFFRVDGGEAAAFGQVQLDNSPRLTEVNSSLAKYLSNWEHDDINIPKEGWSNWVQSGTWNGEIRCLRFQMSGGEVRPRNMAIRIWKRTR